MTTVDMRPRKHFFAFDLIRIAAAVLVLLNHFAEYQVSAVKITRGTESAFPFLAVFDGVGSVGVEIFFVISGFVIATSASQGTGSNAAIRFILLRARRILPTLWISGIIAVLARATVGEPFQALLFDFLRSSVLSPIGPYIDGAVWSLVVEAFFYILVSFAMLSASPRRLVSLALGIGTVSVVYNAVAAVINFSDSIPHAEAIRNVLARFPFKVFLIRHGVFFAIGVMMWAGQVFPLKRGHYFFLTLCGISCFIELVTLTDLSVQMCLIKVFLWTLALGILIASAYGRLPSVTQLSKPKKNLIRFLGALSYPLYLNHYSIGIVISYHLSSITDSYVRFSLTLAVTILISLVVLGMEKRIHKRIHTNYRDRNQPFDSNPSKHIGLNA